MFGKTTFSLVTFKTVRSKPTQKELTWCIGSSKPLLSANTSNLDEAMVVGLQTAQRERVCGIYSETPAQARRSKHVPPVASCSTYVCGYLSHRSCFYFTYSTSELSRRLRYVAISHSSRVLTSSRISYSWFCLSRAHRISVSWASRLSIRHWTWASKAE